MSLPRLDCRMVLRTSTLTRGQTHDSEKDSRPRANIERPAEIPFNCLVVSRLREDRQLAQTSDSQGSGGRIPPGWWFSASGQAKIERGSYILGKCLAEVPSKSSWAAPKLVNSQKAKPMRPKIRTQLPSGWFVVWVQGFDGTLQICGSDGRSMRFRTFEYDLCPLQESVLDKDMKGGEQVCVEPYIARPVAENHHSWLK
jgi:hypothetical protein